MILVLFGRYWYQKAFFWLLPLVIELHSNLKVSVLLNVQFLFVDLHVALIVFVPWVFTFFSVAFQEVDWNVFSMSGQNFTFHLHSDQVYLLLRL